MRTCEKTDGTLFWSTAGLVFLLATRTAIAGWALTAPADPDRNWNVNVTSAGVYDNNWLATPRQQQEGFRFSSDVKFRATVPIERFLMGVQYDYGILYPHDIRLGGVEETHNLNVAANYSVNPELMLSLSETFINSLQPQLVQGPANAPITVIQAGTYEYNDIAGSLNYALSPRWVLATSGSWDTWRYQTASISHTNNHEDYVGVISFEYALNPQTVVGVNYQYTQTVFVHAGFHGALDSSSDTAYLSLVRRFNPQLSVTLNGGYTIRNSEDGTQSTAPSALFTLVYNYGLNSAISLTAAESLNSASIGATGQFSAEEVTSVALHITHSFTARLSGAADLTYVYSTFTAPIFPGVSIKPNEQALTAHFGLRYAFREWLSTVFDYSYTQLESSSVLIPNYNRDLVSLGVTLTY